MNINVLKDKRILAENLYMDKNSYITHNNNNILVVGSPGTQKTLSYVLQNILNTYSESMVIVDVKGDLIKKTAGILKGRGYDIHCLDLKDFKLGEQYNPITLLKTDTDIAKFASIIFPNTNSKVDPFWEEMSRFYLTICIHYLNEVFPKSKQNIEEVINLTRVDLGTGYTNLHLAIRDLEEGRYVRLPDGTKIQNHTIGYDLLKLKKTKEFKDKLHIQEPISNRECFIVLDLLDEEEKKNYIVDENDFIRKKIWLDESGYDKLANPNSVTVQMYKQFISVAPSEKTLASILATVTSKLNLFDVNTVKEFMSANDIDFARLGQKKTALYIMMDDLDSTFSPLVVTLITQLIQALVKEAEKQVENRLLIPVHFYLDDFATYFIPDMEQLIASLRSRGIGMSLILQSETQLNSIYGISGAKTIINSCDTYLYLGGTDIDTARSIATRSNNELKSILELPYGKEYVFQRNKKAILTNVCPINGFFQQEFLKEQAKLFDETCKKEGSFQNIIDKISVNEKEVELSDQSEEIEERRLN